MRVEELEKKKKTTLKFYYLQLYSRSLKIDRRSIFLNKCIKNMHTFNF